MSEIGLSRQGLNALLERYPKADIARVVNQDSAALEALAHADSQDHFPLDGYYVRGAGPWLCVDLYDRVDSPVAFGTLRRFAIWQNTGNVYHVLEHGDVADDPFIEITPLGSSDALRRGQRET